MTECMDRFAFVLFAVTSLSAQSTQPEASVMRPSSYSVSTSATAVTNQGEFDRKQLDNIDDTPKISLGYWPHPYATIALSAMPGGYAPFAYYLETGMNVESRLGIANVHFGYDDGHKTDDGDQPNPHGHDRYLGATVFWRLSPLKQPKWYAGGGYGWSQLSTTNYVKGGARPYFGARYDLFWDHAGSHPDCGGCWFSARIGVDYFTAGSDWQNGSHGVTLSMTMPRPVEKRHAFFTWAMDVFRFHETITEPYNAPLTSQQAAQRYFSGNFSTGLLYRFR